MTGQAAMTGPLYGLVDVGGTKILAAVAREGRILATRAVPTEPVRGADAVMASIAAAIHGSRADAGLADVPLAAVGAAVPGPLDFESGVVIDAHNLGWRDFPFVARLGQTVGGVPVVMDDDANCAGLGEAVHGAGRGHADQVFVTVSTGIGGAVILGGRLHRGAHGLAGEVGHVCVAPEGPACGCGKHGCVEVMAAGPAIARRGAALVAAEPDGALARMAGGGVTTADAALVFEAARAGDPGAVGIVEETAEYLAVLLAGLIQVLDPEVVVLGGGVILGQADVLVPTVERRIRPHLYPIQAEALVLKVAELGERAGLLGALELLSHGGDGTKARGGG